MKESYGDDLLQLDLFIEFSFFSEVNMNKIHIPGLGVLGECEIRIFKSQRVIPLYSFNEDYAEVKPGRLMPNLKGFRLLPSLPLENYGVHVLLQNMINKDLTIDQIILTDTSADIEYLPEEFLELKHYTDPNQLVQVNLENENGVIFNLIEDYVSDGLFYFVKSLILSPEFLTDYTRIILKMWENIRGYKNYRLPFKTGIETKRVKDAESVSLNVAKFLAKFKTVKVSYKEGDFKSLTGGGKCLVQ